MPTAVANCSKTKFTLATQSAAIAVDHTAARA